MGILALEYGYFAFRGQRAAVNDPDAKYNADNLAKIERFAESFFRYYDADRPNLRFDIVEERREFQISSENKVSNFERLREILARQNGRPFSIVVPDIRTDIRDNCMLQGVDFDLLSTIFDACEMWNLQIFSIESRNHPLSFKRGLPSKKIFEAKLMDNSFESKEILQRFLRKRLAGRAA